MKYQILIIKDNDINCEMLKDIFTQLIPSADYEKTIAEMNFDRINRYYA